MLPRQMLLLGNPKHAHVGSVLTPLMANGKAECYRAYGVSVFVCACE